MFASTALDVFAFTVTFGPIALAHFAAWISK